MPGYQKVSFFFLLICSSLVISCTSTFRKPPHGMSIDQSIDDINKAIAIDKKLDKKNYAVPTSVNNALVPSYDSTTSESSPRLKHFDIAANKVPAKEFFISLVEGTPINMVVDPLIEGTISLKLKNVTLEQTLQAVRDAYGFDYHKSAYGYEVYPQKLETRIFTVNYLDVKRKGTSLLEVTSGEISEQMNGSNSSSGGGSSTNGSSSSGNNNSNSSNATSTSGGSVDTRSETNFWKDLQVSLRQFIPNEKGRSVVVNAQSGVVTVHALPSELRLVAHYLDRIQSNMTRQVILEAKILEVQLNDQFQAGIDWNMIGQVLNSDGSTSGGVAQASLLSFNNTTLTDFDSFFTLRIKGDFGGLIKLLQSQGNVQVLSSPRISTVNNQKAIIKVGQDEFFVTGVTSTSVTSGTGNSVFPSQNINLTPFFSGITLDVTPQISNRGEVILHIHPTVSLVKDQDKTIVLGNGGGTAASNTYVLPLAQSTIRESDSIVRAKNGQVIVIGGLMQNNIQEQVAGIPILSKLPGIGPLFRRTEQLSQKVELVILLRPILVDNSKWVTQMKDLENTMGNMRRGFHKGGLPEIFGNEGDISPPINGDNPTYKGY